jgi:UDP-galactose transporter B1
MARTKQATPQRRNPSSEYTSKADPNGTPTRVSRNLNKDLNGNANGHTNGRVPEKFAPKENQKGAGALQLLIAVSGIYGSL